jgi:hypothetical protein
LNPAGGEYPKIAVIWEKKFAAVGIVSVVLPPLPVFIGPP